VGLLHWLGFKQGDEYPHLDALVAEVRRALPDAETVVRRYIAIVVVLLGKMAYVDGRFSQEEEERLRALLSRLDRIAPAGVDAVCEILRGNVPELSEQELTLCYREVKALCDGKERVDVVRLLADLASADGAMTDEEEAELRAIAREIGAPIDDVNAVVRISRA
jgi:DnaJ like chaperone protein